MTDDGRRCRQCGCPPPTLGRFACGLCGYPTPAADANRGSPPEPVNPKIRELHAPAVARRLARLSPGTL